MKRKDKINFYFFLFSIFILFLLIFPIYNVGNRVDPFIFGMPFSLPLLERFLQGQVS